MATGGRAGLRRAGDSDHAGPRRACRPGPDARALARGLAPGRGRCARARLGLPCLGALAEGVADTVQSVTARTDTALAARLRARYRSSDSNLSQPGIGEATRVLLRRLPERLLLRDPDAATTRHLVRLAQEKHVATEHAPELPYHAVGIIRSYRPGATP